MLRSTFALRHLSRLSVAFPLAFFAVACGGDDSSTPDAAGDAGNEADGAYQADGASQSDAGSGHDAASLGDGGLMADGAADADASGSVIDKTPPTVASTDPMDTAMSVSANAPVQATFSEALAPATVSKSTFVVQQGNTVVPGSVSYFNRTATFVPTSPLALGTTYTATLTTGITDLAGNALAKAFTWSFSTDTVAPIGPAPVLLGAAGNYVILAESEITNVPTSAISGNVGLSPAAASYIKGFVLTKAGTMWTSPEVTGGVFASDNDKPTPSDLTTAVGAMDTAYTDAAGRTTPTAVLNLGSGGSIGGLTLPPGLYKWNTSVTVPTDVTFAGTKNDTWILQVSGDLSVSTAKKMVLMGAQAKNIVWQVAGLVDFGANSHAEGIVLCKTGITLETSASVNGRLFAQTAVILAKNAVTAP